MRHLEYVKKIIIKKTINLTQLLKCFNYYISSFSNSLTLNLNKFSKILAMKMTVFEFHSTYFKQNFIINLQNKNWMS